MMSIKFIFKRISNNRNNKCPLKAIRHYTQWATVDPEVLSGQHPANTHNFSTFISYIKLNYIQLITLNSFKQ